jgi:hypothetical protein
MGYKKVVAVITDEQFSQYCVQDRIRSLIIYSPTEVHGLTAEGKSAVIHANWPRFASEKHFSTYLTQVFVVITQMNNGEYQLQPLCVCLVQVQGKYEECFLMAPIGLPIYNLIHEHWSETTSYWTKRF